MASTRVPLTIVQGSRQGRNRSSLFFLPTAAVFLILLSACGPHNRADPQDAWELGDLLLLAPAGAAPAETDLIALYSRLADSDFQVRLDLLDLEMDSQVDLYLALDTSPGGTRELPFQAQAEIKWDLLLFIPQAGSPQALSPPGSIGAGFQSRPDIIPRIVRYPWLDSLVVSINSNHISTIAQGLSIEAFILKPGSPIVADRLHPVRTDSLPPGQASLLLAFWNTYPAYTPAQALRRWDGAHTGPFGEHHGLRVLLQNARRYQVPVTLLDLKNPTSLSAIDLVGGIPVLQELVERDLLILPDVVPGSPVFPIFPEMLPDWAVSEAIEDSRQVAQNFGLPTSRFLYAPRLLPGLSAGYPIIFTPQAAGLTDRWKNGRLIQVPVSTSSQPATPDGLPVEIRRRLLASALHNTTNPGEDRLIVLGGSLPDSAFGDPLASQAAMLYITSHPWMRALKGADLSALPPDLSFDLPFEQPDTSPVEPIPKFSSILTDLARPDENHLLDTAAWQAALALYEPLPPEATNLVDLRALYSGQVGKYRLAADWARSPQPIQEWTADLDRDGLPECLLATPESLAIFDLLGGRLLALFHIYEGQAHQIVGPSSQFLIGHADPSSWDLSAIEAADPGVIAGAFGDGEPPWDLYSPEFSTNSLKLKSPQGEVVKTFTIEANRLVVDYEIGSPLSVRIPLVLDPWQRFSPGWSERYQAAQIPGGYTWQIRGGPQVKVRSSAPASLDSFTASLADLRRPEDPNFAYPPGHYLAFPVALVEIDAVDDFQVEITFSSVGAGD